MRRGLGYLFVMDEGTKLRWLSVVGIGEDGVEGLSPAARRAVEEAAIVFGGARHLSLASPLLKGEVRQWPKPFGTAPEAVAACRGQKVCVLASGDPFLHGIGATLAREIPIAEMAIYAAPSAFSLAAACLGWPLHEVVTLALHAAPLDLIRPHLQSGTRILALMADGEAPGALAALLCRHGFGASTMILLEALGGPRQSVRRMRADMFAVETVDPLNLVALDIAAAETALPLGLTPGRPDDLFEHDGQLTKREARALALAALAPRRGELLWDIGGGSGSIAIEWLLANPTLRAVTIERDEARAARIARNAKALGVPHLHVLHGTAPDALADLSSPGAIFVGGGCSAFVLESAEAALPRGGRLVVHAVTLETEALLLHRYSLIGGQLVRLDLSRATPVGTKTGWRPAMPLTQWTWIKP
jgi:precorrin-6Y C5,15-methyltransferase (decarboxylating)